MRMALLSARKRRKAFEKEALEHLDALYGVALRLTQDVKDAEDLVQDTMVKALRFFHRFQQGSNIKAWLFKVMINLFYNSCRKRKNQARVQREAENGAHFDQFLSQATLRGQSADRLLIDSLAAEKIRQAIEELPEEFKLAVLLSDLHDLSYREISDVLGCPVGTVMSRLYRGRRLLQKQLLEYAKEQGYIKEARGPDGPAEEGLTDLERFRQRKGHLR